MYIDRKLNHKKNANRKTETKPTQRQMKRINFKLNCKLKSSVKIQFNSLVSCSAHYTTLMCAQRYKYNWVCSARFYCCCIFCSEQNRTTVALFTNVCVVYRYSVFTLCSCCEQSSQYDSVRQMCHRLRLLPLDGMHLHMLTSRLACRTKNSHNPKTIFSISKFTFSQRCFIRVKLFSLFWI